MVQQISIPSVQQPVQTPQSADPAAGQTESFRSVMEKAAPAKDTAQRTEGEKTGPKGQKDKTEKDSAASENTAAIPVSFVSVGFPAVSAMVQSPQTVSACRAQAAGTAVPAETAVSAPSAPAPAESGSGLENRIGTLPVPAPFAGSANTASAQSSDKAGLPVTAETPRAEAPAPKAVKLPERTEAAELPSAAQTAAVGEQPADVPQAQEKISELPLVQAETETQADAQAPLPDVSKTDDENRVAALGSYRSLMQSGNVVIKISDAPSGVQKAVLHRVADQISVHYKAGSPQFEMQLFPKNLGKVTVKLGVEKGNLTVEILAANPKTQSMLLSGSDEIRSLIESTVQQPVLVQQPSQNTKWDQGQGGEGQSGRQQQQQEESRQQQNRQDTPSASDFIALMQRLRTSVSSV